MRSRRSLLSLLFVLMLTAVACSTTGSVAPTVSHQWVRPPLGADRPAAGYLVIVGGETADELVGASSPVAASVEIHETTPDADGMMAMHPVAGIPVGSGETVRLEPGGYHLMLMGVTDDLVVGEKVELTLTFQNAGDVVVQAEIRAD
jgi:copper(I)-binding protein